MRNIQLLLIISLCYTVTVFGQAEEEELKPLNTASEAEERCLSIDCIDQGQIDPTVSQIQDLASTNCTALINSPACEHVPQEDRKVCSSNPQSNQKNYLEQPRICLTETISSISDILSSITNHIVSFFAELSSGKQKVSEEDLSISLYLHSEFDRIYENEEGTSTKKAASAALQMTSSFFSILYDSITKEFPCLNTQATIKKVCRYLGGTVVGGGAGYFTVRAMAHKVSLALAGMGGMAYMGYAIHGAGGALLKGTAYGFAKVLGASAAFVSDEEFQENIQRQIRKRLKDTEQQ